MWKIVFTVLSAVFATGAAAVMVGGLTTIDINDEGAQNALNYAVNQHNMKSNDAYLRKVTGVNKVQVQVVAGSKYVFDVTMARTNCRKSSATELCEVHTDPKLAWSQNCKFSVWSQPWLRRLELLEDKC
ncbi:cystatin C (amyloid angiopathy and cerebral hemorrhage) [Anabas testudineus]|uniref:Cystatin domain-containing protein n=1 Tax=Anabas testudineus TaxID=64144 RepID=A0A7N5ZZ46_ANATE|nr:cystatin C (amyloid angiopathy and cerebral hemorrhage) [Anabas testudineus]